MVIAVNSIINRIFLLEQTYLHSFSYYKLQAIRCISFCFQEISFNFIFIVTKHFVFSETNWTYIKDTH